MSRFVLWIDADLHGQDTTALVGGKAAGLVSLVKLGVPVPPAFAITAEAYTEFLGANQLTTVVTDVLEGIEDWSDTEALGKASDDLRNRIIQARMPDGIRDEILEAYRSLQAKVGPTLVAVRSSATAEDLPTASFAGQQETFLNVNGEDALLQSVKRCWASVWTARSMAYRHKSEFVQSAVKGCVIVQEMFPSEASGVLFTVNPISGDMTEMVVNSSWGLGEAIVSGLVNPDEYVLDKESLQIKRKQITDKQVKVVRASADGGTRQVDVESGDRRRESIGRTELRAIGELAKRIEDFHGWPQDIEWGIAQGRVSILQTRPVTGVEIDFNDKLEVGNRGDPVGDETIVWSRWWSDAFQTGPCSPLMYSFDVNVLTRCYDGMYELYGLKRFRKLRMLRRYKARPYFSCKYERERIKLLPKFARSDEVLSVFPPSQRAELRTLRFEWWARLWAYIHLAIVAPQYSFHRCIDTFYRDFAGMLAGSEGPHEVDLKGASFDDLLQVSSDADGRAMRPLVAAAISLNEHLTFLIHLLTALLRRWCGDEQGLKYAALVSGLRRNKTSEENVAVWNLSRLVRRSEQLKVLFAQKDAGRIFEEVQTSEQHRSFRESLDQFLAEYGHRGASERDLIYPRWRQNPRLLISQIKTLAAEDDSMDPTRTEEPLRQRRERTERECYDAVRAQRFGWLKLRVFRFLLKWTQEYVPFRDDVRFYFDYGGPKSRDRFREIGRRLAEKGILADTDDVFFLSYFEIIDLAKERLAGRVARVRVDARRRVYEKYRANTPPKFLRGVEAFDSDVVEESMEKGVLRGFAASAGRTSGRARVCRTLEETEKIERGDVLVACATDPGWTPIFSILGAVVVETGGILAHSTLVSREYGIPCVTNVNRATELIRDCAMVVVDGNQGRVTILEEDGASAISAAAVDPGA